MSLNSYGKNRQYPLEDSFLERRVKLMNGYTNWFKNYRNTNSTINSCEQHSPNILLMFMIMHFIVEYLWEFCQMLKGHQQATQQ